MKLYNTIEGIVIENEGKNFILRESWDSIINNDNVVSYLSEKIQAMTHDPHAKILVRKKLLPPVVNQEIWASGVTYYRSKKARMDESKDAGGGDFYDRVYDAPRPELFFKCAPYRAVGNYDYVRIRGDSAWNVPEPELTLVITSNGKIIGYTIGNDMSSRDIEGENPLYLPQAKTYDGSAALGPCIFLTEDPFPADSKIKIAITRKDTIVFTGQTSADQMKRSKEELVDYLFKELSFEKGVLLMTGTGIVPPDSFTLYLGDKIEITIDHIGTLTNTVK